MTLREARRFGSHLAPLIKVQGQLDVGVRALILERKSRHFHIFGWGFRLYGRGSGQVRRGKIAPGSELRKSEVNKRGEGVRGCLRAAEGDVRVTEKASMGAVRNAEGSVRVCKFAGDYHLGRGGFSLAPTLSGVQVGARLLPHRFSLR